MDGKWASDTFYSHFPSFNNQEKQKEHLAQARHQEYQQYLTKVILFTLFI